MQGGSELERRVAVAKAVRPDYGSLAEPIPAPELPNGRAGSVALAALRELFAVWGLDAARFGTAEWNPLGVFIRPGARVVLKPNWVTHRNYAGAGMDCMITHPSVIEAVLEYLVLSRPGPIVIGDAPIQSCDFPSLLAFGRLENLAAAFQARGLELRLADFRRTVLSGATRIENRHDAAGYVLFDLAGDSLLEALSADAEKFRVTVYDPGRLRRTHAAGRHQYLIAREVIDADVVINLPKLKTHKKTCLTGALKNLVGINGNKEFLPHHSKGGALDGGDCYPGHSWLKEVAETALDAANRRPTGAAQRGLAAVAGIAVSCAALLGSDRNLEGSWYGNDTIWRTCLDLNRIVRYGCADATMADRPQRQVVSITDAIVAGEGEGPLAPAPVPAGILTGAANPAAAEWVHARLMGFDPRRIPLVREAFGDFRWPLVAFGPDAIRVCPAHGESAADRMDCARRFRPPEGWRGHCECPDSPRPLRLQAAQQ